MTGTRYARYVLFILTLVNLFNYLDRYVVISLFTPIKGDLGLSDFQLGLLETAVEVVLAVATIPMGIASDVGSRKAIISAGLLLWSGFTMVGGLVRFYWQLFLCRALVGIGESSYAPSATALIVEYFPAAERARAIGVFSAGMGLGGMSGLALGGMIAHYVGWRAAFFLVGLPGVGLTLAVWRLRAPAAQRRPERENAIEMEDRPVPQTAQATPAVSSRWQMALVTLRSGLAVLSRTPTLILVFLGGIFTTFAVIGLIAWGATYLSRHLGFSLVESGLIGGLGLIGVILGNLYGGLIGDWLIRRTKAGRVIVAASGFLLGAPFCIIAVTTSNVPIMIACLLVSLFLFTWYNGPLTATIFDVVPAQLKATTMACYNFCVHLLGASLAAPTIGRLSDMYGLPVAITLLPLVAFIGGLIILMAAWTVEQDMAKAMD